MAVQFDVTPAIPFSGIEQRGNNRLRPPAVAENVRNIEPFGKSEDHGPRRGRRLVAHGNLGLCLALRGSEIVSLGSVLYRLKVGALTVEKTGGSVDFKIIATCDTQNPADWVVNATGVNGFPLTGFPLAITPADYAALGSTCPSVEDVRALLDAVADMTATVTGEGTTAAVCLPIIVSETLLTGEPLVIPFYYVEQVFSLASMTASAPFIFSDRTTPVLVGVELAGNTYFPLPNDPVIGKYDGVDFYGAGLTIPEAPVVTAVGAGSVGSGSWADLYSHFIVYIQYDASGNQITGERSAEDTTSISALSNFSTVITNLRPSVGLGGRLNTAGASVVGNQSGVTTIDVDNGAGGAHTLQVGHTAYFLDLVSGTYTARLVTARTSSTITIAGAAVDVNDNQPISNNLRIQLWRTEADGTLHRLVAEVPNDCNANTQTVIDATIDSALGEAYEYPELDGKEHGFPPSGVTALAVFSNEGDGDLLIAFKDRNVYFSDLDGPESFPAAHVFEIASGGSDIVGGIQLGNELLVFQRYATWRVFGDLVSGEFRKVSESSVYGCAAQATVKRYDDAVIWCGPHSVYRKQAGAAIEDIGTPIWNFFKHRNEFLKETQLVFEKAVAEVDAVNDRYLLHVPALQGAGNPVEWYNHDTNSVTFAYYFQRRQWYAFRGLNMAGGVVSLEGDIIFCGPTFLAPLTRICPIYTLNRSESRFDFFDWNVTDGDGDPISYEYESGWIHGELPATQKKMLNVAILADNAQVTPDFSVSASADANFGRSTTHSGPVTLSFSSTNGFLQKFEVKAGSIRSLSLVLAGSVLNNIAVFSSWLVEIANAHLPKVKK